MKTLRAMIAVACLASPMTMARAEEPPSPGFDFRQLEKLLDQFIDDIEPAIEDAWEYLRAFEMIDDPRNYQAPEVLPNGDIILRRRPDAPPYSRPDPSDENGPKPGVRT